MRGAAVERDHRDLAADDRLRLRAHHQGVALAGSSARAVTTAARSTEAWVALDGLAINGVVMPSRAASTACALDSSARTPPTGSAPRSPPRTRSRRPHRRGRAEGRVRPGRGAAPRPRRTRSQPLRGGRGSWPRSARRHPTRRRRVRCRRRPACPAPSAYPSPTSSTGPRVPLSSSTGGPTCRPAAVAAGAVQAHRRHDPGEQRDQQHPRPRRARPFRRGARDVMACRAGPSVGFRWGACVRGPSRTGSARSSWCSGPEPAWSSWSASTAPGTVVACAAEVPAGRGADHRCLVRGRCGGERRLLRPGSDARTGVTRRRELIDPRRCQPADQRRRRRSGRRRRRTTARAQRGGRRTPCRRGGDGRSRRRTRAAAQGGGDGRAGAGRADGSRAGTTAWGGRCGRRATARAASARGAIRGGRVGRARRRHGRRRRRAGRVVRYAGVACGSRAGGGSCPRLLGRAVRRAGACSATVGPSTPSSPSDSPVASDETRSPCSPGRLGTPASPVSAGPSVSTGSASPSRSSRRSARSVNSTVLYTDRVPHARSAPRATRRPRRRRRRRPPRRWSRSRSWRRGQGQRPWRGPTGGWHAIGVVWRAATSCAPRVSNAASSEMGGVAAGDRRPIGRQRDTLS